MWNHAYVYISKIRGQNDASLNYPSPYDHSVIIIPLTVSSHKCYVPMKIYFNAASSCLFCVEASKHPLDGISPTLTKLPFFKGDYVKTLRILIERPLFNKRDYIKVLFSVTFALIV